MQSRKPMKWTAKDEAKRQKAISRALAKMDRVLGEMESTCSDLDKHLEEADAEFDKAVDEAVQEILKRMGEDGPGEPEPAEPPDLVDSDSM